MNLKYLYTFLLCMVFLAAKSQDRAAFYSQIEDLIENDQLEEIISEESNVETYTSETDTISADIFSIYGESYLGLGQFEKSITYFEKALKVREQLTPKETKGYSNVLYNLTYVYLETGNFNKAKITAQNLLNVDASLYGKNSDAYLESVLYYSDVLSETGAYADALKVLDNQIKVTKNNDFALAVLNTKKGDVLSQLGNYEKSKEVIEEATVTFSDLSDTLNFEMAQALLGLNYINQGKYPLAENIFLNAKNHLSTLPDTEYYINDIDNNLALAQLALGRYNEAILIYKKLLAADSATFGLVHPNYINSLINIGVAYHSAKNYKQAQEVLLKSLELCPQVYGEDNEVEASILNNLANVYRDNKQIDLALTTYKKSKALFEKTTGKKSANYATVTFNMGKAELLQKASTAEKTLLEALKLRKDALGESHPKYAEVTNYLGIYYWQKGDLKKAGKYFEDTFNNFFEQIRIFFPSLSEEEKTKFYLEKLRPAFEQYNSIAALLMKDDPSILGKLYNYQLRTKGIIMVATERLRRNIYNSQDSSLIKDYELWKSTKEQLSKLYSNNDPRQNYIDSLNTLANTIEKGLVNKSSEFANIYKDEIPDWKQVQGALKADETAVEIIRYRVADPENGGEFTSTINYLALVIDKQSTQPRAVLLTRGNLMEGRYLNNYRNSIRYQIEDNFSYQELWKPLENQFKGFKKVFISPDGVYNQVNLSTLKNPETGEYLIKEVEIQEVTSTRDILTKSKMSGSSSNTSKVLFGFPTYTLAKKEQPTDVKVKRSLRGGGGFSETRGLRGGLLRYMRSGESIAELPGTKTEVEEIEKIYLGQGQKPTILTTTEANESSMKQVKNPGILHIATHGYFLEDVKSPDFGETNLYYQNPLLRAGIILAGAEDFLLTGANPVDTEDGILTAYEAMNMDLNNTDLVVLSACETGLGEVSNGEGVYGLQRAFKIAGARYMVMSMWNVDDEATQRLMTLFYEQLAQGKEKYYAFRDAQLALMDEYKEPFYWGAFKIVGE